jgi:ABC-type bacteriocin/lantibiotic exporter with double-glycine peptidase domain
MSSTKNNEIKPLQRLARLMHNHHPAINAVMLYAVFMGIINLTLPLGIQAIIGFLAGGSMSASWGVLTFIVIFGILFAGLLRYLQMAAMEQMQRKIFADAAFEFAVRIPHLQLEKLRQAHLPELANRFFDTLTIQKGLPKIIIDGSTAVFSVALSLLIVSFYHPLFLSFSVGILVIICLLFWLTFNNGLETSLKESKYKYQIAHWLEELSRVAATFQLSGAHRMPIIKTDELATSYMIARKKHFKILVFQFVGSLFIRVLVMGSFLILGSLLVMDNELNIGQFVAAEILIIFVVESLEKIILLMETLYDVLTATEKIGQFTDLPIEAHKGIKFEEINTSQSINIEWRNLSYRFENSNEQVLTDLNFIINGGDKIAIVGYNGAGKSTLMQINSGLLRDFTGALLYNGIPAGNINMADFREHIGDLSSQEDIFKGTILENITLGRDISLSKVLQCIESIGLSQYVQSLPLGLNTLLLPSGRGISGSIFTKILLTRAIVCTPNFLMLEYPLLKLDADDRSKIIDFLTDPKQKWTMLCVTDNEDLAAKCDKVLVLKEGKIEMIAPFTEVRKSIHADKVFKK